MSSQVRSLNPFALLGQFTPNQIQKSTQPTPASSPTHDPPPTTRPVERQLTNLCLRNLCR